MGTVNADVLSAQKPRAQKILGGKFGRGRQKIGQREGTNWAEGGNKLGREMQYIWQGEATNWAVAGNELSRGSEHIGKREATN